MCNLRPEVLNRVKIVDLHLVVLPVFATVILKVPQRPRILKRVFDNVTRDVCHSHRLNIFLFLLHLSRQIIDLFVNKESLWEISIKLMENCNRNSDSRITLIRGDKGILLNGNLERALAHYHMRSTFEGIHVFFPRLPYSTRISSIFGS